MKNLTIGIFDSGSGGITVMKELANRYPLMNYVYLGDHKNAPYGSFDSEKIYELTLKNIKWLIETQNVDFVVIACNTATIAALDRIKLKFKKTHLNVDILGIVEPTIEYLNLKHIDKIGVLATPFTVSSHYYQKGLSKFNPTVVVYEEAAPMFVPMIEYSETDSPAMDYFVKKYTNALIQKDGTIKVIGLFCTHYPILLYKFHKIFSKEQFSIITQGEIVASNLQNYLIEKNYYFSEPNQQKGYQVFYTTGSVENFSIVASTYLQYDIDCTQINIR